MYLIFFITTKHNLWNTVFLFLYPGCYFDYKQQKQLPILQKVFFFFSQKATEANKFQTACKNRIKFLTRNSDPKYKQFLNQPILIYKPFKKQFNFSFPFSSPLMKEIPFHFWFYLKIGCQSEYFRRNNAVLVLLFSLSSFKFPFYLSSYDS